MNKLFTKIAALTLGVTMAVGVGVAVASGSKEATPVHAASDTLAMSSQTSSDSNITAVAAKSNGSNAPITATVNSHSGVRMYANNTLTISSSQNITSLTIPWYKNGSKAFASVSVQSGGGTYTHASSSGNSGTWTGSSKEIVLKVGSSGQIQLYQIQYVTAAAKTLSSISVSGYTTSFTVGDTFSFGGTVTAHYSDSTTANVTSSATFSGYNMSTAGNYTVTASYTEGSVTKTATYGITVSAPSTPFITPAKSSTSGYTGTNESLSFTYGNLTGSLSVTSSNISVVTVGTPSTSAGSGTVQINFVTEGSTTVKFKDGSTELASVSVSVSDPTVTITGMPSARSIATGATLDLGSLITVTPTGNLSSDVTWSTSNSSFASVTQSGVVTGEAVGSATITVTPDDYPAGAVSCTVTVANVMTAVFGTTRSNSSTEITDASKYKTDYSYTIDTNITLSAISKVYPQTSNALKFGSSSAVGSMTFSIPSTIDSKPVYITSVTVRAERHHATNGTTMLIGGVEKVLTYSADDYTADLSSGEVTSFVLTADSSSSDKRMYVQSVSIQYAFKKTLSSIALSGSYQTTFTKGGTFNHDGLVVTATYSDSSTADVTSSATFSGYDLSNTGNQTVTVSYTEGTTKTATYPITVNYAAVTSVTLNENTAEIGLGELFNYNLVTVTVSPSNANPAVTWSVLSNTVGDDYTFNSSGLKAGNTEGAVTLKCASDADSSKYATLVVTVTGDPTAEFVKESTSGYAGKTEEIAFTYGNIDDESKIAVASSNPSIVSVAHDLVADEGEGLVTINFVAAGSANVTISYNGGATLDTLPVTVSADSVVTVNWTASNIKVYSGAVLPVAIEDTWMVNYEMASGDTDFITYSGGDYSVKLGGSTITLPHTWVADDDGKTLCVEYGGVQSSTVSVDVTQTLQAVMADVMGEPTTKTWNASSGALGSSMGSTAGVTDSGSLTFDDESTMSYTRTLEYLASGKSDYVAWSSPYIQFGSSNALETLELDVTNSDVVTQVQIYCWAKNGATNVTVTVGGNVFDSSKAAPSAAGSLTFSGSASGNIVITMEKASKTAGCAQYIASVAITTATSSGTQNIANVAGHEDAQKAVVKFAKAFNTAMDTTSGCTTNMSSAWTSAKAAWTTFNTDVSGLSEAEQTYAKNLIKYATVQWTSGTDSDYSYCLERCLATYEKCVTVHGQEAFMADVRSFAAAARIAPLSFVSGNGNTVAIIVIISMISVTAIGGYFFLRKRKEQ